MLAPLWSELTSWLAANAPRLHEQVRPPGDPARLASAEERLGLALNRELVEWWQLHDGVAAGYLLPNYELFGVEDMLRSREIERDVDLEEEVNAMAFRNLYPVAAEGDVPGRYFPSEYVPIGGDGAGNCLVMDCRPGPEYGFLRDHDHEHRGVISAPYYTSLADLLTRLVTALRTGQPMAVGNSDRTYPATAVVEDGWLSWR
ncbi:SMI1/KNR4 family protein [Catenuloplanes sp. NPDC051500]|uniref:SMI1/KNR4 family protein n=1 Tax=Catenuloplanes sp. NPDC051500 TaxID=3363959 RepID=UPI00379395EC